QIALPMGLPETATELLEPEDARFSWPQHHDSIDLRQVHPFIQHVDSEHDINIPITQLLEAQRSGCTCRPGMDGSCPDSGLAKELRHKVGVACGTAKGQCATSGALAPLLKRIVSARSCCHRASKGLFVETTASPGNVAVVDVVRDSEIVEGDEQVSPDRFNHIAAVHKVLCAQCQEIAAVGSFRCRGKTE